ncbi:carboxylesterase family protein [Renibacterium salmoninarum]|nr:carboxylesterase family protein [Renibacterium salmoninarum]
MPHDRTLVQTESGPVRGEMTDGVLRFLGIPYAAAPWDELRFKAPQPVQWTEVRAATAYGATVPQLPYPGQLGELLPPSSIRGAEVLNLNVWTPNSEPDQLKPVLFWIHGGRCLD